MSKDLKSFIKIMEKNKNFKNTQNSQNAPNAQNSQNNQPNIQELSKKSQPELQSEFQQALQQSKENGTLNKDEMIAMLSQIKTTMSKAEYERVKGMIEKL